MQAICAVFFVIDIVTELFGNDDGFAFVESDVFEAVVVAVLVGSLYFTARDLRNIVRYNREIEDRLQVASGAFMQLLDTRFAQWGLTTSERDVETLIIKGLSNAEIAALRGTRQGTVKAQSATIYRKARVTGRTQFLSQFIDELVDVDIASPAG